MRPLPDVAETSSIDTSMSVDPSVLGDSIEADFRNRLQQQPETAPRNSKPLQPYGAACSLRSPSIERLLCQVKDFRTRNCQTGSPTRAELRTYWSTDVPSRHPLLKRSAAALRTTR